MATPSAEATRKAAAAINELTRNLLLPRLQPEKMEVS